MTPICGNMPAFGSQHLGRQFFPKCNVLCHFHTHSTYSVPGIAIEFSGDRPRSVQQILNRFSKLRGISNSRGDFKRTKDENEERKTKGINVFGKKDLNKRIHRDTLVQK